MEQKNELKVYRFEVTGLKKNEDGTVTDERITFACAYAYDGDPSPRVEYNNYWDVGDGCLSLAAKDGKSISSDVCSTVDWVYDYGFRGADISKRVNELDNPGKWAEICLGDAVKTTLRITRLQELPEIDPEATIKDSDLSPMQQHRVKINGVPLFPDGGTVLADNPNTYTLVLRSGLERELGKVWEEFIRVRSGAVVHVAVDPTYHHADSVGVKMTIKAPTRKELDGALCAIGVLRPQDIVPDFVEGEGDTPTGFAATVLLTTML